MSDLPFSDVPEIMLEEADEGDYVDGSVLDSEEEDALSVLFRKKKKKVCN